jgi:periplasmic protein TorT
LATISTPAASTRETGDVTTASLQGSVATTAIGVDQAIRGLRKMRSDKRLAAKPIVVINDTLGNYDLSGEFGAAGWKPVFSVE